jgi:hypothetical protein
MTSPRIAATLLAVLASTAAAGEKAATSTIGPGPGIGRPIPAFHALDQDGGDRDFASLRGPKGLVLVFFRSADW